MRRSLAPWGPTDGAPDLFLFPLASIPCLSPFGCPARRPASPKVARLHAAETCRKRPLCSPIFLARGSLEEVAGPIKAATCARLLRHKLTQTRTFPRSWLA
jgi:hypothetical protein